MFYSGGARKKNAIREMLKIDVSRPKPESELESERYKGKETETETETDTDTELVTTDSSDSEGKSYRYNNRNHDATTKTDTDSDDDSSANLDHNNYIVTLGSNDVAGNHHHYAFIEEELEYDLEEFADTHPEIKKYHMVIYKINTQCSLPFLEFLFYYDKSKQATCYLPNYYHKPKQHIRKETDGIMNKLFTGKYRYNGYFHDTITDQCFIFYEKYFINEPKNETTGLVSLEVSDNWLWICTTEVIYNRSYMNIPIHEIAVNLFITYPTVGLLQATIVSNESKKNRFKGANIEAPTVLYYGSDICYAKNTAIYGLKRESIVARYGPFYYFTTLQHSFYWACYLKSNGKTKKREISNGGISRYAVFTKKMKTVFSDDEYDKAIVKKYMDRKNTFETKIASHPQIQDFVDEIENNAFNSIYSYDYNWTNDYDTIYNGYYNLNNKDILRPVWSVCDHHNFQLLSYYEVNLKKCPEHYDSSFVNYKIM
jgi:hypothetical protein